MEEDFEENEDERQKLFADIQPLSAARAKISTGKCDYVRGRHPVKQAVNDFIIDIASREFSGGDGPDADGENAASRFALLLETGAAQSIATMLGKLSELRIPESNMVVPNPSLAECSKINRLHPEVLAVPTTSHELLRMLDSNDDSNLKKQLGLRGWRGTFDFIWLDYCGTFSSKPGRRRQEDIVRLFTQNLIGSPAVLAVTSSQRGAVTYYEDEVVDVLLGFVKNVTSAHGVIGDRGTRRKASCAGVAIHNITSRIYTVVISVDSTRGRPSEGSFSESAKPRKLHIGATCEGREQMTTPKTGLTTCDAASEQTDESNLNGLRGGSVAMYDHWTALLEASNRKQFTPLFRGLQRIAARFAQQTMMHVKVTRAAFIMDSKLLPVTKALVDASWESNERLAVTIVIPDVIDAIIANDVAAQLDRDGIAPQLVIESELKTAAKSGPNSDESPAVWMSYPHTMSASDFEQCHEWRDLHYLLERGWIKLGTVLGLHLKYNGMVLWEDGHIDWLLAGIRRMLAQSEARQTWGLVLLSVFNFTFRAPHVILIIRVVDSKAAAVAEATAAVFPEKLATCDFLSPIPTNPLSRDIGEDEKGTLPPKWSETHNQFAEAVEASWVRRCVVPSTWTEKYREEVKPWISAFVIRFLERAAVTVLPEAEMVVLTRIPVAKPGCRILLHEPGFHYVLPELITSLDKQCAEDLTLAIEIHCCAANDHSQFEKLKHIIGLSTTSDARCQKRHRPERVGMSFSLTAQGIDFRNRGPVPDVAILLCDGGVRRWRDLWFDFVKKWIAEVMLTDSSQTAFTSMSSGFFCLVFHFAAQKQKGSAEGLIREVRALLPKDACLGVLPAAYYLRQRQVFALSAIFFRRPDPSISASGENGTHTDGDIFADSRDKWSEKMKTFVGIWDDVWGGRAAAEKSIIVAKSVAEG